MAGRPSRAQEAAQKQYDRAPADSKPTARELALKNKISETAIYQSTWWKNRKQEAAQ